MIPPAARDEARLQAFHRSLLARFQDELADPMRKAAAEMAIEAELLRFIEDMDLRPQDEHAGPVCW